MERRNRKGDRRQEGEKKEREGAIQMLRSADGGGGGVSNFSGKKCYDLVRFNVIWGVCGVSRKKTLRNP